MIEIRTARLVLRPFALADARDLFSIRGDREAMRYWDWPLDEAADATREVARGFVDDMEAGQAAYFTARLGDGAFVGVFDLSDLDQERPDLGFMVRRSLWGQGYGGEGARAMVEEARRRARAGLKARIRAGNDASRRLLQKLGFWSEGPARAFEVAPGRVVDCEFFARDL